MAATTHVIPSDADVSALRSAGEIGKLSEAELDRITLGAQPEIAAGIKAMHAVAVVVELIESKQPLLLETYATRLIDEIEPIVGKEKARDVLTHITRSLTTAQLLADVASGALTPLAENSTLR